MQLVLENSIGNAICYRTSGIHSTWRCDVAGARYDVAIVGGSLAGSAAATFFGRAGLKVALLERHADPKAYKRLCTTVIQAGAVPTLRRVGLDAPIEAARGLRTGLAPWARWGWVRDTPGREPGH